MRNRKLWKLFDMINTYFSELNDKYKSDQRLLDRRIGVDVPVVWRPNNVIQRINHYPTVKCKQKILCYRDRDQILDLFFKEKIFLFLNKRALLRVNLF